MLAVQVGPSPNQEVAQEAPGGWFAPILRRMATVRSGSASSAIDTPALPSATTVQHRGAGWVVGKTSGGGRGHGNLPRTSATFFCSLSLSTKKEVDAICVHFGEAIREATEVLCCVVLGLAGNERGDVDDRDASRRLVSLPDPPDLCQRLA